MAKIQAKAAREGEKKPFGGSAVNDAHKQLRWRGHTYSDVTAQLPNHMLDSLEG